jgi:uncharacterized protein DUF4307
VSDDTPVFPAGRYGRRREPRRVRRWVPAIVLVLLVLGSLWVAQRLYTQYGDPYQPHVTGLEQVTDRSVTVVFTVQKPDSRTAMCRIQARDSTGAEVGYAEVSVGTAGTVRTTLTTSARASTADVLGCRAA